MQLYCLLQALHNSVRPPHFLMLSLGLGAALSCAKYVSQQQWCFCAFAALEQQSLLLLLSHLPCTTSRSWGDLLLCMALAADS